MKFLNKGIKYKSIKSRRPHSCVGCVAYKTTDLCNELIAQSYAKCGKLCKDKGIKFEQVGDISLPIRIRENAAQNIDKKRLATLTSYIHYVDSLPTHEWCVGSDVHAIITGYQSKLKKLYNIKEKDEA